MSIDGLEVLPTVLARRRGDRVAGWVCPLLVLSRRADQLQKGVLVRAKQTYFARNSTGHDWTTAKGQRQADEAWQ